MLFLRQGATHKVVIGPVVAVANGYVPVTTLDLTTADEKVAILHDNGTVVSISAYTFAAITSADGYYHLTLQSGITGTVGHVTIVINDDSLCLPVKADFTVIDTVVYDALFKDAAIGELQGVLLAATQTGVTIPTVTTLTGHTAQTGDSFARLGAPAGASISADIAAIEAQTDDIGAAGAGLTAVPWNAAWDAEVQSEVNDALVAYNAASTTNITAATGVVLANAAHTITSLTATAGVAITQSVTNEPGLKITGNGTGHGILATSGSGATGDGLRVVAASTDGNGLAATGNGQGAGAYVYSGAGSKAYGMHIESAGTGTASGLIIRANGSGAAARMYNAGTGSALYLEGGPSGAGHGLQILSGGTGDGIKAEVAGTGVPIRGDITGNITGNLSGSVGSVTAEVTANAVKISGSAAAADNLEESTEVIGYGTCTTGGSTTSVVASAVSPTSSVNDQFNGRVLVFKGNTTAALAGQATTISDYDHATLTFTVVALTTEPASGDLFVIL